MEKLILGLFLYNNKLKFSEIEKSLKERSNKLTYHLNKLVEKGVLEKNREFYRLSETAEVLIPYLNENKSVLSAVLVLIENEGKVFLIERNKRPFKGTLGLPGGRILLGETIPEAVERIMKKHNVKCKFEKVNSVSLEHVKTKKREVHSFLLILVTAKTKENLDYFDLKKNKKRIISSDLKLIENDSRKKIEIEEIVTRDF